MVVIYERDVRNTHSVHPFETACNICGNRILYRLGDTEAMGGIVHRQCPVCKQESRHSVPSEIQQAARKHVDDSTTPEMREAAEKWFNKQRGDRDRMRKIRAKNNKV